MTTREKTTFLALGQPESQRPIAERAKTIAWFAIQWPWLLKSLWGGRKAEKQQLLDRLGLPHDALPHLGSWKADTDFLWNIATSIEERQPQQVVELGCGASSLIIARALANCGGGRLLSFDQHAEFALQTRNWLISHGLDAFIYHAPIAPDQSRWASCWYDLPILPETIDMLVLDGPPWVINPTVRGRAETLFSRIPVGGVVLLDDAARPGERLVASRWRRDWPNFEFTLLPGVKGTLNGERMR